MENKDKLTLEELCEIDLELKLIYRQKAVINLDNLIITGKNKEELKKLKDSTVFLSNIENEIDLGVVKEKWKSVLQKQLRASVDRAKKAN